MQLRFGRDVAGSHGPPPQNRTASEPAEKIGATIAILIAAWVVGSTLFEVIVYHSPLPFWDQWQGITLDEILDRFFLQHNEHRLIFPRLVFIADILFFSGSNSFNLASMMVIQGVHAWLLAGLMRRARPLSRSGGVWAIGIAFSLLFWAYQTQNFGWGFQVQFVGVFAAGTAAFAALLSGGRARAPLALALAGVAAFTMANGVAVPPLLVVLAILLRRPRGEVIFLFCASAILLAVFFIGYRSVHALPEGPLLTVIGQTVRFGVTYLGAPIGWIAGTILEFFRVGAPGARDLVALGAGAAGLLLLGAVAFALLPGRDRANGPQLVLLHVMGFIVLTAMITGVGRSQHGAAVAFESRYGTPAIIFWTVAAFLVWSLVPLGAKRIRLAVPSVVTCFALMIAFTQPRFIEQQTQWALGLRETETALLARVLDADLLRRLFINTDYVFSQSELLRANKLSIFADDWAQWLGTPLSAHVTIVPADRCEGRLDQLTSIPNIGRPIWRARGWSQEKNGGVPDRIVLTGEDGIVIGYGLSGLEGANDPNAAAGGSAVRTKWRGHVSSREARSVIAYALVNLNKEACPLSGPIRIDPEDVVVYALPGELGAPVPMRAPAIQGGWAIDGYALDVGIPPIKGDIYASWNGNDANTGTLQWQTAEAVSAESVIIPFATGPTPNMVEIRISDPRTGAVLAKLSNPVGAVRWKLWKVDLRGYSGPLQIDAVDAGTGWGEWIAVGQPHLGR